MSLVGSERLLIILVMTFTSLPSTVLRSSCEVKAMTGSMNDRPVGLSRAQFKQAQENGNKFWLYVVEHAGTKDARILRIQDPAGKARIFTFDRNRIQ